MKNSDSIMEQIKSLEAKVDLLDKKMSRILFYLESDPSTNQQGVIERTEYNAQKLRFLEQKILVFETKAGVYGLIGGMIITLIMWFVKTFLLAK